MKLINKYYFVLCDVIIRPLSWTIANSYLNKSTFISSEIYTKLKAFENLFSIGKITKDEYFLEVINNLKIDVSPRQFEATIIEKTEIIQGTLDVINEFKG